VVTLLDIPLPVVACLVMLVGCQYVSGAAELEIVDQPTDAGPWGCVGHRPPALTGTVNYAQPIRNLADDSIPAGVVVKVCGSADLTCSDPLVTTVPVDGTVTFTVPADFIGYLELDGPLLMPTIVELTRPIGAMRVMPELRVVGVQTFTAFAALMHVQVDATRGHALFWAVDCQGNRAAGISAEALGADSSTQKYYVLDGKLPSLSVDRTDSYGGGGFVNLPILASENETFETFRAFRAETGARISEFSARIRAGHVTCFQIEPD
jgi:hypothetical protein